MTIKDVVESHLSGTKTTSEPEIREILLAGVVQVVVETQLDGRLQYMRIAEVTEAVFAGWWTVVWGEYPVGGGNGFDARTFGPVAYVLGFLDVWIGAFGCEADLPPPPRDEVERRLQMGSERNVEPDRIPPESDFSELFTHIKQKGDHEGPREYHAYALEKWFLHRAGGLEFRENQIKNIWGTGSAGRMQGYGDSREKYAASYMFLRALDDAAKGIDGPLTDVLSQGEARNMLQESVFAQRGSV